MLLKNGSTGNYVMYLQYGLHIMCCPPGSFDSKFGSGTENAVKKYQGKKGLTQDGIVGDGTFGSTVAMAKRRILSQRLLILAVAPLQAAFPSLILLVVSFELLRKRELHAMKPYTVIISQPLVAPKYLYSLHQQ